MYDWIKITKHNIHLLVPGMEIKFHNGYEWTYGTLNQFWIDRGFIGTGVHSETAHFIHPMFGDYTYYKQL